MKNAQNIPNLNSIIIHNAIKGFYSFQMSPCDVPEKPHKPLPLPFLTGCFSLGTNSSQNREIPPLPASPKWEESKITWAEPTLAEHYMDIHGESREFAAASGSGSRPTAAALGPYFLHKNQYFSMSSKQIHLTPKRHSLNPLHRVTQLLQSCCRPLIQMLNFLYHNHDQKEIPDLPLSGR